MGLKKVITNLDNYFKNGASNEFKNKFVQYLKKWSKSIFNLSDAIKTEYDFQKVNIELYASDMKHLALFFGARENGLKDDCEPEIIKNKECEAQLRNVEGAMEMYQLDKYEEGEIPDFSNVEKQNERFALTNMWKEMNMLKEKLKNEPDSNTDLSNKNSNKDDDDFGLSDKDTTSSREKDEAKLKALEKNMRKLGVLDVKIINAFDFPKMSWKEVIKILKGNGYLRKQDNLECPFNGKRTIKVVNRKGEVLFDISCNCGKKEDPRDDFRPDSKPMKLAKEFRDGLFEFQKEQFFKYYDNMARMGHSKPMTETEMTALTFIEIPAYKFNVLLMNLGFGYKNVRISLEEKQKLIDDFIKTYDK